MKMTAHVKPDELNSKRCYFNLKKVANGEDLDFINTVLSFKDNTCCIYRITNFLNNKIYIGKSTKKYIFKRMKKHAFDDGNYHIKRAYKKYGIENFYIDFIEINLPNNIVYQKEKFYINYFNSFSNGYNSTLGGEGGNTYAKKSNEEMRLIKEKISKANKGSNNGNKGQFVGEKNSFYGKHHTSEAKEKIQQASIGRKHSKESIERMKNKLKGRPKDYCHPHTKLYLYQNGKIESVRAKTLKEQFRLTYKEIKYYSEKYIIFNNNVVFGKSVETIENIKCNLENKNKIYK